MVNKKINPSSEKVKALTEFFYLNELTDLVVDVAVCKHGVEILQALAGTVVIIVFKSSLDSPHIHGLFDDFEIILHEIIQVIIKSEKHMLEFRPITCSITCHLV